jgi:hypothetical protein
MATRGAPLASESEVLRSVLAWLKATPRVAWAERMNVGAVRIPPAAQGNLWEGPHSKGPRRGRSATQGRMVRFGFRGCSDIIGQLPDGRFLAVEVKRADGRLTEDQAAFLDRVRRGGGVAGMVRSVEDAMALVPDVRALRPLRGA